MGKSTELRNKIIAKLAEALQTEPGSEGYTMEACAAIALEVEGAMDAGFSKEKEYMSKGRSLVFNLQKNAELRRNVLTRDATAEWLVTATAQDLAPERLKLMREQSAERYMASRSLSDADTHVVGWAAGTTGKVEFSQKFDEKSGSAEAKETIDLDEESSAPPADAMDAAAPPPDLLSEAEVAEAKAKVAKARARMAEAKASSSGSAAPAYAAYRSLSAADPPPRKKARAAPAPAPPPPKPKRATSIFAPALQPVALASLWKATAGADGADAIDAADADANAARVEAAMGRMREAISDVLGGP
jgi:hypothetical protein